MLVFTTHRKRSTRYGMGLARSLGASPVEWESIQKASSSSHNRSVSETSFGSFQPLQGIKGSSPVFESTQAFLRTLPLEVYMPYFKSPFKDDICFTVGLNVAYQSFIKWLTLQPPSRRISFQCMNWTLLHSTLRGKVKAEK